MAFTVYLWLTRDYIPPSHNEGEDVPNVIGAWKSLVRNIGGRCRRLGILWERKRVALAAELRGHPADHLFADTVLAVTVPLDTDLGRDVGHVLDDDLGPELPADPGEVSSDALRQVGVVADDADPFPQERANRVVADHVHRVLGIAAEVDAVVEQPAQVVLVHPGPRRRILGDPFPGERGLAASRQAAT